MGRNPGKNISDLHVIRPFCIFFQRLRTFSHKKGKREMDALVSPTPPTHPPSGFYAGPSGRRARMLQAHRPVIPAYAGVVGAYAGAIERCAGTTGARAGTITARAGIIGGCAGTIPAHAGIVGGYAGIIPAYAGIVGNP